MTTALGIQHLKGVFSYREPRFWLFIFNNVTTLLLAIFFGFMTSFLMGLFAFGASIVYGLVIDLDEVWAKVTEWRRK